MPLTFIDIERKKNLRIAIMFVFLIGMYFFFTLSLLAIPAIVLGPSWFLSRPLHIVLIMLFSVLIAGMHFWLSASNAVTTVVESLGAVPPDRDDAIHRQLLNITDEINISSGAKKPLRCLVIPSLSLNALAVSDLRGDAVIGITEGLLSRLTRAQIEAVMAHEAYHILSGDCLETTVAASLFGLHASAIEGLRKMSDGKGSGTPLFILSWLLLKLSLLLNMFISREREYRADAASLRMTRNPLAMAEALHLLSGNWTGSGIISNGLEMLCIINPGGTDPDESEGWWADLFSTHPPLRKRIAQLLKLARMSVPAFERKAAVEQGTPEPSQGKPFFALDHENNWVGPFSLAEMTALPWLTPLTWIAAGDNQSVVRASEWDDLTPVFSKQSGEEPSDFICPLCRQPLFKASYEQTSVYECRFCGGVLVETGKLPRIIARRGVPCSERIMMLAKSVIADNQRKRQVKNREPVYRPGIKCSRCGNQMFRTFYSLAYLIEIDRCGICRLTWFDRDELEMLQCLIENRVTLRMEIPSGKEDAN
jgi:heat shock protein HtpX